MKTCWTCGVIGNSYCYGCHDGWTDVDIIPMLHWTPYGCLRVTEEAEVMRWV